ncbi:cytochrome C oxidase subunit IV family protein [Cupriavidus pauculus]|uniref:cytochrome C oxidase subunit IV family protein n=1 Tax=Cupriavidus pauculus TaxID=82633 RepID=UPI001EE37EAB|nr:cytochrome C oxidase subunit IV family protein [Cupriavidus pauculus]GJG97364.1 cytochrome C oxidase subunit IV [Cupriavidus pauculus]
MASTPTHAASPDEPAQEHGGQSHSIKLYLKVWLLLFVLSTLSYMVDYYHLTGYLRWTLILLFMALKAGLIIAVFMHMAWERMALICAILLPPLCLLVLVWLMAAEADYTFLTRGMFFR